MTETTEPTREQIEAIRDDYQPGDVIYGLCSMALRTLDAEAKLESCRQVEACSKAFHDLVVKERDFERVRAARLEEERDVTRVKLAAMTERAERAEQERSIAIENMDAFLKDAEDALRERQESVSALREATERAEKAERLSVTLRALAEKEVAEAIVKSREQATRIGWIDHATGDYEERSVTMLMDDLAAGSAVCAFLRMVGVWTLEDRAEKAERERNEARTELADAERRIAELSPPTVLTTDARLDCESSSLLLLSTWARRVMMREKNRAKGVPSESVEELIVMAQKELDEARDAIEENAPTDDILAELGDAAAYIAFAMREVESRRNR